jgi:asparagine synthase (glutamine-hydrolysing)
VDWADSLPFAPAPFPSRPLSKPSVSINRRKLELSIFSSVNFDSKSKFFSGEGGDHMFMCPPAIESLSDLIINKKFSILFMKIKEIAMQRRISFWSIANNILNNCYLFFRGFNYKTIDEINYFKPKWFLADNPISQLSKFRHPIYKHSAGQLPGQFYQINSIYNAFNNIEGDIRGKAVAYPLLTQPIIEMVLSIPTYELYDQGFDRYIFRDIVSKFFKTDHVWRKDKGEVTGVYQLAHKAYKEQIHDLCLEGYFASNKMIEKDILRDSIGSINAGHADDHWPVIYLISLELFIKSWQDWWCRKKI